MSKSRPNNDVAKQPLLDAEDAEAATDSLKSVDDVATTKAADSSKALVISFLLMVVVGLGNKIFQVLEFIPMNNYPLFLNILTTFVYIPASFAYVFPMLKYGKLITREALSVPQYKWAVMGFLDSLAGIMQSLAVNYVSNGALVTLLMQAAVPSSMVIAYIFLKERYKPTQYFGAIVVTIGLVVVLLPTFLHPGSNKSAKDPAVWAFVLMLSCVPMCLSSVYKQKALGDVDIDPVYMNGWVAVYQFLFSIPLLIPSAIASNVSIKDLPDNIWNGMRCLAKHDSVSVKTSNLSVDDCHWAPAYVSVYILFNLGYNVLIILILKYGSSNILWLAMTVMVPLANLSFALPFMPNKQPITWEDVVGLLVIMTGLLIYRFYAKVKVLIDKCFPKPEITVAAGVVVAGSQTPYMPTPVRGTLKHVGGTKKPRN